MVGITSYGAYIPWYRIDRKIIYSAMGWINPATRMPGEKAVANFDEDSITMAVAAGDAVKGGSAKSILLCAADYRMGKPVVCGKKFMGTGLLRFC